MHQGYLRGDIGTGIEPGRGVGAGDLVIVGAARYLLAFMDHCYELAVMVGGEPHMMSRLGSVGGDRKPLVACRDQLYRPVEPARRDRDQGRTLGQRAARAEGATDKR